MFMFVEIVNLAAVKTLLVGIPESVDLLVFGIGLVAAVVLLRWLLNRRDAEKPDEKFNDEGLTNN